MDIKLYKKNIEEKLDTIIKSMVTEGVVVQSEYDLANDAITILLLEEHLKGENENSIRESLTVYNCYYRREQDVLSIAGFNRRYGYDAFGIAQIVNDPITVDENFINAMKHAIISVFQDDSSVE